MIEITDEHVRAAAWYVKERIPREEWLNYLDLVEEDPVEAGRWLARQLHKLLTAEHKATAACQYNDSSTAVFTPYIGHEHGTVGFICVVNGKTSHVFLNPSRGGDSTDVFIYHNGSGDPADGGEQGFVGLDR